MTDEELGKTFQASIDAALMEPDGLQPSTLAELLISHAATGEFEAWLLGRGHAFLTAQLTQQLKVTRAVLSSRARARAFGKAVTDDSGFSAFTVTYRVDPEGHVKTVENLTRDDLLFVAEEHEHFGKERLMLAAFHRSIAKKVGNRTVGDVMSAEQFEAALAGFMKRAA